jgi:hypothetical protein
MPDKKEVPSQTTNKADKQAKPLTDSKMPPTSKGKPISQIQHYAMTKTVTPPPPKP